MGEWTEAFDDEMTGACAPMKPTILKIGYRRTKWWEPSTGAWITALEVAEKTARSFELFLDLLEPLGDTVDVVVETSHHLAEEEHVDHWRHEIDMPVLRSVLCEFEHLLVGDGGLGIAVLNPEAPLEVQFDNHKMIYCYGDREPFEKILDARGLGRFDELQTVADVEHYHWTTDEFERAAVELMTRLGVDAETGR